MEEEFRAALAKLASGVVVIATRDGEAYRGMTATSFTIASWEPPLVLVGLDRLSSTLSVVLQVKSFSVSLLAREQEFLAERFADQAPAVDSQWRDIPHQLTLGGLPVVGGSLAWLECELVERHRVGDHDLLVAAVRRSGARTGDPLLRWERRYWSLA
ncbi:MAG: flavin reductase family protein [Candidatus Dormibacteraceae bacterium]